MVSQQRSLFRQLPQTVSQTSRVASPVDSSWGRIAEMASVSSRTLRMASAIYCSREERGSVLSERSGRSVISHLSSQLLSRNRKAALPRNRLMTAETWSRLVPKVMSAIRENRKNTPAMRNRFFPER